jgi:HlyD family secretion protein
VKVPARAFASVILALAACKSGTKPALASVQTARVERRDIVVDVEATGVVEPINVVEVKSKASGQIVRMPVETGSLVRPGDLLVQLDTRDVKNQYDQALADVRAAQAKLDVSRAQRKRTDDLFQQGVVTAQEHEAATLDYANAEAQVVRGRTNLDLARQRLDDATVRAPVAGTVIEKDVSLGQVISSATATVGGGTTLLKMADLNQVRVRALVNETDIGLVAPGQTARVTVDAYPNHPFTGVVEKIEPQAVVQQSVTMFPVLVSIQNREGLLKPGMNGEVAILVQQRNNVLAVPNDAVRAPREAAQAASLLGLNPDSVRNDVATQLAALGSGGGRGGRGMRAGGGAGSPGTVSPGAVDLAVSATAEQRAQVLPQVTDEQCAGVRTALAKKPEVQARLQQLRARMRSGELAPGDARTEMEQLFTTVGLDARVARACQRRDGGGAASNGAQSGGAAAGGADAAQLALPGEESPAAAPRNRPGLVFVADSNRFTPRVILLGVSNYDYSEVVRGLKEGEQVALLSAAALQQARQQQNERIRGMTGGGVPGMQRQPAGGAAAGGGGGGGRAGRQP